MRKRAVLVAGTSVVAVGISLAVAASANADVASPVVGHAYVNGNTAGVNTVDVLDRHADGSLTPTPGSPGWRPANRVPLLTLRLRWRTASPAWASANRLRVGRAHRPCSHQTCCH